MNAAINLQQFCARSDDSRGYLRSPWTHKGHTYACNGHILVRLPCDDQQEAVATDNPLSEKAATLLADAGKANYISLPAFPHPKRCIGCGGDGQRLMVRCEDCEGEGTFDHGHHEYQCKECEGDGLLGSYEGESAAAAMHDCPECGGMGFHHASATVGDSHLSTVYLRMLSWLPGLRVCTNGEKAMHFTFDGGEGLLMPRRAD